jgi:hypothetical protein
MGLFFIICLSSQQSGRFIDEIAPHLIVFLNPVKPLKDNNATTAKSPPEVAEP